VIDPFSFDIPESFQTERLSLRLVDVEDADDLLAAITASATHLRRFIDWAALDYELDEVERRIRKTRSFFAQRDSFEWLIWAQQGERLVGAVDLHSFHWSLRRAEFGFWTTVDGQGHGYIAEAGAAILSWAESMFWRIESRCDQRNQRSQRTLARLQFLCEGTLRRNIRDTAGKSADEMVFARLPSLDV
jgi:ribosomal-protein-serine acetyltransferase